MPFEPQHMIIRLTADFELDPTDTQGRERLVCLLKQDERLRFLKVVDWQTVESE